MLLDILGAARLPITLESGLGARVQDTEGRSYWDFYGGHAVTLLGQAHPAWVSALTEQASKLSFMTTLTDVPVRTAAGDALCDFTGMDVAWFVNSGAEANEAALKIARKATGRPVIIAMEYGFHGRSMGALGVTWKYRDQHAPTHGEVRFVPFGDIAALAEALDHDVAAVITEPIQGIAGVVVPPPEWLAQVADLAHAHGALLIADEVQSGMGRTGYPLACRQFGVQPDIVTVGKGLGGGFPVAALLLTQAMADTVKPGEHGTTFGGAPLACAAVDATLRIMQEEELLSTAIALGEHMLQTLAVPGVTALRGSGAWVALVLDRPAGPVAHQLRERGFLVGTATDPKVLRLAPPAATPLAAVDELAAALTDLLALPA